MGSELLGEPSSQESDGVGVTEKQPIPFFTDIFYQCLPQYLAMGMSVDEFMNCDPCVYKAYREKDRIEKERENQRLWLQGMYVYQSILLTAPRLNSIKPKEPLEYPQRPFDLGLQEEEQPIKEEEHVMTKEEVQASPKYIKILDWAMRVNKQRKTDGR